MRYISLFGLLLISLFTYSQETALQYSAFISPDSIKKYLEVLASDSLEGRETGQPGQKKAANFLSEQYMSWNLTPKGEQKQFFIDKTTGDAYVSKGENKFLQDHTISIKNNKSKNLTINETGFLFGQDFFYESSFPDTPIAISSFQFIGVGKKAKFENLKSLNNKTIIYYDFNIDSIELRADKIFSLIQNPGIPSIIFLITTPEKINNYFARGLPPKVNSNHIIIYITPETARNFFEKNKYDKVYSKINRRKKPFIRDITSAVKITMVQNTNSMKGENVLAFIPGSDLSDQTIVISSHYDHLGIVDSLLYPGADDNGSGTSAVLELARVFSKAKSEGHGPRRNILFLNVSGEEKGLFGSKWFVANPTIPLESIVTDLNIDMVGRTDFSYDSIGIKQYVYVIGSDKMSTELRTINETQNKTGPNLTLNYKYDSPDDPNHFYYRSDHYNFVKKNIPVIFYFDGLHADYHKPTDRPEKIDYELLATRARLVFLTAWELANRNDRIVIDKPHK